MRLEIVAGSGLLDVDPDVDGAVSGEMRARVRARPRHFELGKVCAQVSTVVAETLTETQAFMVDKAREGMVGGQWPGCRCVRRWCVVHGSCWEVIHDVSGA